MLKTITILLTTLMTSLAFAGVSNNTVTLTKDNILNMNDYFEGQTVANIVAKAKELDSKVKSGDPIILVLNSGGGEIDAGIEMIENLNSLNRPVMTLTIFAASMGFQTVQGVKQTRLVLENGTLMSHKARGGFSGEFPGQLDSRYGYYLKRILRLDQKAVDRTKGKHTLESYRNLIENEYWCDGQDCVDQGFADKVVNAKCDSSLDGTYNKLWDRFMYMGHTIEIIDVMSNCPLNTNALSYNIYIDGEPLFMNSIQIADLNKAKPEVTSSYNDFYNKTVSNRLGLETIENIKKLVSKNLESKNSTNKKEVKKY